VASSKWKTWEELEKKIEGRKVIFWGASNWIERTLDNLKVGEAYVVDTNPNNHGTVFMGLSVYATNVLTDEVRGSFYVVITTANYQSVVDELGGFGLVMGDEYCCTPLLNERRHKDELKGVDRTVLLTSPMHYSDETNGGGLYAVQTRDGSIRKVYSGKGRGLVRAGEDILMLDMLKGLVILDDNFDVRRTIQLQTNSEPHGLYYDQNADRVYIGQPGRDSIAIYSLSEGTLVGEIFISDKWSRNRKDNHHINDIYVHDGSLFICLFSFSGNWMHEVYDGGILEICVGSEEILGPVVSGLWMPHSVQRIGGQLTYLDSMRGELRNTSWDVLGKFNGFLRGLDFDGRYYYVGTTEHRYPEKLHGLSRNISLDTGFHIFDAKNKMSRFFSLPVTDGVHSVLVVA